ncbi:MAG: DUF1592 domain-containing protein [Verrucomicrobiales bacterium]
MIRLLTVFTICLPLVAQAVEKEYEDEILPLLEYYCYDCHGDGMSKGGFTLDEFESLDANLNNIEHWEKVWRNVQSQIMPPSEEEQFTVEEKQQFMAWIEKRVFKLDPKNPDPGAVTIRRLNRTEYGYAVSDLLGVRINTSEFFPADDTGHGFDTIGSVLSISPLLMEKYVEAAEDIMTKALPVDGGEKIPEVVFEGGKFEGKDGADPSWVSFEKGGELTLKTDWKQKGEFEILLEYEISGSEEATEQSAGMELRVNDVWIGKASLAWDQSKMLRISGLRHLDNKEKKFKVKVWSDRRAEEGEGKLGVEIKRLVIRGPLKGEQKVAAESYRRIFKKGPPPADPKERQAYAEEIIRDFALRAYRRPVNDEAIKRLVGIAKALDDDGQSFEDGIRMAFTAILASPRFLFRAEVQPEPNNPAKVVPIDEYALASRLSFFLWSSVPDEELLKLASENKLRENLKAQVERLIKDSKSQRFVENFVGQWLQARDVHTVGISARRVLPKELRDKANEIYNYQTKRSMKQETEYFFRHILRENRPVEEMISADYSFLNERLAKYYGVEGVKGGQFRKVVFDKNPERGGLLTQGTILTVTSNPTRTSPVKRGLFVLENILGTPAPPAPPGVPELEEAGKEKGKKLTMRQMMEIHRAKSECRGCHARMDPIGLGLENFDALGLYREEEHGEKINSAGQLVTGEKFNSVKELKQILADKRKDDFYRCLAEKLITYATGRGVDYYDAVTMDLIVKQLKTKGSGLQDLVLAVIESAPFQKRRGEE